MSQTASTKRMTNYELLRILAMMMVIVLHYLTRADALPVSGKPLSAVRVTGNLLESLSIVAVNVYVLMSGYFLVGSGFRWKRILRLLAEILFYTILIPVVLMLFGIPISGNSLWGSFSYFLPISTGHYWFVTSYVMMYMFSPVMNASVSKLTRQQLKWTILGLLFFECFLKSICPILLVTDLYGYDPLWFICLYLVAAYIRKYGLELLKTPKRALALYLLSTLGIFVLSLGLFEINRRTGAFEYYMSVPYHYNFILGLLGAIGLFGVFQFVTVKEGIVAQVIRYIAPLTFGVYLIHEHVDIKSRWFSFMSEIFGAVPNSVPAFLLHLLLSVLVMYVICIFIDWIRSLIFTLVGKGLSHTKIAKGVDALDEVFQSNS